MHQYDRPLLVLTTGVLVTLLFCCSRHRTTLYNAGHHIVCAHTCIRLPSPLRSFSNSPSCFFLILSVFCYFFFFFIQRVCRSFSTFAYVINRRYVFYMRSSGIIVKTLPLLFHHLCSIALYRLRTHTTCTHFSRFRTPLFVHLRCLTFGPALAINLAPSPQLCPPFAFAITLVTFYCPGRIMFLFVCFYCAPSEDILL